MPCCSPTWSSFPPTTCGCSGPPRHWRAWLACSRLHLGVGGMTRTPAIVAFLNGAVAMAYLVAGVYFLRFWRKTRDRLFPSFSAAFVLLATNLAIVVTLGVDEIGRASCREKV